jgi:hypothetical protein
MRGCYMHEKVAGLSNLVAPICADWTSRMQRPELHVRGMSRLVGEMSVRKFHILCF